MRNASLACAVGALLFTVLPARGGIIHFDELPAQALNGVTVNGVTFHFSIASVPSNDAQFGTLVGPGNVVEIHPPNAEGNSNGLLTIDFAAPVSHVDFGLAISDSSPHAPAAVGQAFAAGNISLGNTFVNTAPPGAGQFSQGHFSYTGAPLVQLQVDFLVDNARFAIDNLAFDLAPAGGGGPTVPLPPAVWAGLAMATALAARTKLTSPLRSRA
jgi:hypothetical protein